MKAYVFIAALIISGASAFSAGFVGRQPFRIALAPRVDSVTALGAAATLTPPVTDVSVILLAGGVGSRMKAGMPKQVRSTPPSWL